MILSNFWKLVTPMWGLTARQDPGYVLIENGQVDISGTPTSSYQIAYSNPTTSKDNQHSTSSMRPFRNDVLSLRWGKGTTEVAATDYCMADDCTSMFTGVTQNLTTLYDNDKLKVVFTYSGAYTQSQDPLTITEVGILMRGSTSNYNETQYLIARQLLDTPIVLNFNDVFNRTVAWDFS